MEIVEIKRNNIKNIRKLEKEFKAYTRRKQNTKSGIMHYHALKTKPILYVEKLYKKYPRKKAPAINHISFKVYPGQFHAFIGANGAGKTTSIKSIIGAYARWSGTVLINGHKNTSIEAKRSLGYIPENARFPSRMSCFSYLIWMARLSGLSRKDAKRFAVSKLNELNLWSLKNKSPNSFSSGQKKKVLLAQALIHDPQILVMDEPAANLDPKARLELFDTLNRLRNQGKAIFISSHVLAELDRYANAATILDGGKIVFSGTTQKLFETYADRKVMVNVDKKELLKKYLKDNNIKFKLDSISLNYIIRFVTTKQETQFFSFVAQNNIALTTFSEIGNKLDDIYKKLIKYGSVDTMGR